jgi:hypothetical protein
MKNIFDSKCKSNAEENENISKAVADRKSPVVVAVAKSALGSIATEIGCPRDVRFPPESRWRARCAR